MSRFALPHQLVGLLVLNNYGKVGQWKMVPMEISTPHCHSTSLHRRHTNLWRTISYRNCRMKYIKLLQEKDTKCGTYRPPMCRATFFATPRNILVHLQQLYDHSAYQFKLLLHLLPFGRNLKEEFSHPQFWGLWEWSSGLGFAPIESPPATSQYYLSI